jgi:prepilin-type N-terminal cleavage/methylation domain-containing protein
MKRYEKHNGFTIIEATIAMVILAIAAAGIVMPFVGAGEVLAEGARQTVAANLAGELMEKVLTADPNTLVDAYDGYTEADGAMLDTEGQLLTDAVYDGFSRSVACQPATVASVDLVAVTASVYYQGNEMTRVTTLVGDE